jgi:predicted nucleotidyltransferase/DNA-binding XRE family transcriptional regulator
MVYPVDMDARITIGEQLVRTRRATRTTQAALAQRAGTTQQQIARWEASGYRTASLARVDQVAGVLGVDLTLAAPVGGLLAAEAPATYTVSPAEMPVRDLTDVVSRLRSHGSELRKRFGVRRLGVYGSFVAGTQRADSDVDLIAELEHVTFDAEFGAAARLQEILGRKVDLALPGELRPALRERVLDEVLYVLDA